MNVAFNWIDLGLDEQDDEGKEGLSVIILTHTPSKQRYMQCVQLNVLLYSMQNCEKNNQDETRQTVFFGPPSHFFFVRE